MSVSNSTTCITEFKEEHCWTVKNWRSWSGCPGPIWSDELRFLSINREGLEEMNVFQIKANPEKFKKKDDGLQFYLVCKSSSTPAGSFHFEIIGPNLRVLHKLGSHRLDQTCFYGMHVGYDCYVGRDDLTVKVVIKIPKSTKIKTESTKIKTESTKIKTESTDSQIPDDIAAAGKDKCNAGGPGFWKKLWGGLFGRRRGSFSPSHLKAIKYEKI